MLRPLARVVGVLWMLVLALFGLGVAMYCFDALVGLGSVRPDRLLHLPDVRRHVGRFLDQLAAPGSTAGLALLCGLGAMLLDLCCWSACSAVAGSAWRSSSHDEQTGTIAARARPLRDMARALAEPVHGATSVKRPKLALSRHGTEER